MTRVTHSFAGTGQLREMLVDHGANGTHLDRDGKGRCTLRVSGFSYTVDFRKRTVKASWWQQIKNFFTSHCGHGQKPDISDLKKLIFAPGKHFTEPNVARWVFRKQLLREKVAIPTPAYDWLGEAKPPSAPLSPFKYLGEGTFATVSSVVWGEKAGPLMVEKTAIEEEETTELIKEQLLLSELNHPNIIRCYPWIAPVGSMLMDDGGVQLFDACDAGFYKEPREVLLSSCQQLLSAMAYLHERDIVHRDIKPENVLINPNTRHIQLADFGLAKDLGPTGTDNDCVGTLAYMAPEVFEQRRYRTKPDVYSAGVTMFSMLCGVMLRSDYEIAEGIYQSPEQLGLILPAYLLRIKDQFNPEERAKLANVLGAMLDPDPTQRITAQKAQEILASFDVDV